VAVVYDSGSRGYPALGGRTRVLAEAVAKGAEDVEGTAVTLIPVAERAGHWEVLDAADAIIFGCPTYMAPAPLP
jgi:multimeric flavodoxin WrbA